MDSPQTVIEERLNHIRDEFTTYVHKKIDENYKYIHLWLNMFAPSEFTRKILFLSKKYLDGIITDASVTHLAISSKHMLYGIISVTASVENYTQETIKKFAKWYIDTSFEHMDSWNWLITDADPAKLNPIREMEDEPEVTPEQNNGFPSWIQFRTGSKCSCCDDDESVQYEESDPDSGCESE